MGNKIALSFVIPAFHVSKTIGVTLRSIFTSSIVFHNYHIEVIVVDDGSPDRHELMTVLDGFPNLQLLTHEMNRGMCAARNTGIWASRGDIIAILDADDELVPDWPGVMDRILRDWPKEINVCFSACRNPDGQSTVSEPGFSGLLTLDDLLNEQHSGEYLPLFRGPYIRSRGYVDLRLRKSCGIVSYLVFSQEGPFWITPKVLRIYNDKRAGSVSSEWTNPNKAKETARCYEALFTRFGGLYMTRAPRVYRTKLLRYAVYLRLAGERKAWRVWVQAARWGSLRETLGVLLILILGKGFCAWLTHYAKHYGFIRRYG